MSKCDVCRCFFGEKETKINNIKLCCQCAEDYQTFLNSQFPKILMKWIVKRKKQLTLFYPHCHKCGELLDNEYIINSYHKAPDGGYVTIECKKCGEKFNESLITRMHACTKPDFSL